MTNSILEHKRLILNEQMHIEDCDFNKMHKS